MVGASFKQTGWDVIGSSCTIGIDDFKQPLDFCYRMEAGEGQIPVGTKASF